MIRPNFKILLTIVLIFCTATLFAQGMSAPVDALLREGTSLHDAKKYEEAIAKYDAALKMEPNNALVMYEKAFSFSASGKKDDALALLEKMVTADKSPRVFALLANIYDERKEFDKAVSYYKQGIAVAPKDGNLWYNLSISYIFQKKYAEADAAATEAIKINQKHANSQRTYAIANYNQGRYFNSILAWCNFLIMEPQTPRSVEALNYIKHMLYANVNGNNIKMSGTDKLTNVQQLAVSMAVTAGLMERKTIAAQMVQP
ncbi:tetratricopeptide repeat protein [Mucilaginibacter antarcticus]|uniref:tetratricopeptide repeat protein n=1 Tax=Mucilaginibacter antarcticus TaxID=1855725 RepID=UPI003625CF1C